jgi:hypothetical protein
MLFGLIAFCLSPVFADDDPPPAPEPTKAEAYVAMVETFVNDNMGGDQDYINELTDMAAEVDEENMGPFDPESFMQGVNDRADDVNFGDHTDLRNQYLRELADFFLKGYLQDMKDGITDISTADYLNDIDTHNTSYEEQIYNLDNPPETPGGVNYQDPNDFLDATYGETRDQRNTKIELFDFFFTGANDNWTNYNIIGLVNVFKSKFSNDSVAQADFQYLLDLWPQSAESYLMNSSYQDDLYDTGSSKEIVINEYGMPATRPSGDDPGEYDETEFDVGGNTTSAEAGSYNNRQYGYSDGTRTIAKITSNGRTYTLTERYYTSPLLLDLDGNGEFGASNGFWLPHNYEGARLVEFDMTGDGFLDLTEWVGPTDGLLMVYDKEKGHVSANDLFGNAGGFDSGYEKLSLLDENGDSQITGSELSTLSVWSDANGNAMVDKGEVQSVQELGITMISLNADKHYVSHFIQNGKKKKIVDWYPSLFPSKRTK